MRREHRETQGVWTPSRRTFLKAGAGGLVTLLGCGTPFSSGTKGRHLRWLGWEHYDVPKLNADFEAEFGVEVSAGYFDGNSEAYTRLQAGGVSDFDLVMADGFWPRLYFEKGLTQGLSDDRLQDTLAEVFPAFLPDKYPYLHNESLDTRIAAPNCWGGYGLTVNVDNIASDDQDSLGVLFNDDYAKHISTSARFEENIALAGILACFRRGTIEDTVRPDGTRNFNPYDLFDDELEDAKQLLIEQKRLLVTRWPDEDTLERLLRSGAVWVSPEWSGIYRRIHFERLAGKPVPHLRHVLRPKEGGLGWVDTWMITSGVTDPAQLDLAYEWIKFRLRPENMALIAEKIGWSPTVDVRSELRRRHSGAEDPEFAEQLIQTLFLNNTSAILRLYQFDQPSSPEKWERVWTEVEAA